MRTFLTFRLYGPMASWGQDAVGEVRPSELSPSRSGLLGLVAAALGLLRQNEEAHAQLAGAVRFAVRGDSPGVPLVDYHTAQTGKARRGKRFASRRDELRSDKVSTVVSERHYRCDAAWTVAAWLEGASPWSLEALAEALRRPIFTLYLGRKSCPLAWPLEPRLIEAETATDALGQLAPETSSGELWGTLLGDLEHRRRRGDAVRLSWDAGCEAVVGIKDAQEEGRRRDQPTSRLPRRFAERRERWATVPLHPTGKEPSGEPGAEPCI